MSLKRTTVRELVLVLTGLVAGLSAAVIFYSWHQKIEESNEKVEKRLGFSGYINPILDCDYPTISYGLGSYPFETNLLAYLSSKENDPAIEQLSFYFKDLSNGPVVEFNSNLPILGGSLLKVPLAIGLIKMSEKDDQLLKTKVIFNQPDLLWMNDHQGFGPAKKLVIGHHYTHEELLERTIIYSDNVASNLLENYEEGKALKLVTDEMGIPTTMFRDPNNYLTIKKYAGFFRILYNSSYLSTQSSNKLLSMLARVDYPHGLRAGVPNNIPVAHKFGEMLASGPKEGKRFYNHCGIIYFPQKHYLLCLSLKGKDLKYMRETTEEISRFVFGAVRKAIIKE